MAKTVGKEGFVRMPARAAMPTRAMPIRITKSTQAETETTRALNRVDQQHREQAQGVVSHRRFGDQPLRAGTHSADRPGIGRTEHIKE